MSSGKTAVLPLVLVLLLAVAAIVFVGIATDEGVEGEPVALEQVVVQEPIREHFEVVTPPREIEGDGVAKRTTVLWPLEVDLDLVEPSYLPRSVDGPQIGVGRRARLAGQIADAAGEPVRARIEFVEGANQGRVLLCGSSGEFGANDLYPGLAIVEVKGPGIVGSRREIVLRQNTEFLLNIGYGQPGAVQGEVLDADGNGIAGARVFVDGQMTRTDDGGFFSLGGLASDRALLEIEAEGYAGLREVVGITANYTIPRGDLVYRLERGASLDIAVSGSVGETDTAQVILLPADTKQQRRFPWYRVNPIEAPPGGILRIDDLPSGAIAVRTFQRGALAQPAQAQVSLRAGEAARVDIALEPAPLVRGVVTHGGAPVPGARVRMEAPDRVKATLGYFQTAHWFLESEVLPPFPFAVQECLADAEGKFAFTAWAEVSETRFVEAWSPDGTAWGGVLVKPQDARIVVALAREGRGQGELTLELPERTQGLDVRLVINGMPAEPFTLGPTQHLVIDELLAGIWRVKAAWYAETLLDVEAIEIEGEARLRCDLPRGAIEGHDRESWVRAGREYPGVE